jgi:complement component 1 Q subcomponent-binding protein
MGFALCIRRSASTLASVCGRVARAQAVSAIVNRSSLVPKPSLLRPFVSRGFPYSTATEPLKSDQTLIQVIDSEIKDSFEADDHDAVITDLYHLIPGKINESVGFVFFLVFDREL